MKNEGVGNTLPRSNFFSEVFFSNPSAIRMAPSSPVSVPALEHTTTTTPSIYHPQ
jgi:hypothetical protein